MNFERTIQTAVQKTAQNSKNQVRYYSTKFEPPKKLERTKKLSANIQKFLARKEEEEKQKSIEARDRRDKLLELRSHDKKATRRVNVMLKRTKSANQSAIQDAVTDHTSITIGGGPSQPDEDDYGYVSQSAADYYNKMMEKYSSMPDEKKWDFTKKKTNGSLSSTKNRVKDALNREEEEAMQPHRRKRKHTDGDSTNEPIIGEDKYKKEEKPKPKIKAAPVINFNDLLKIAEKKQFEPIKVEPKKEKKEEERLLTKKQKREQEKEREYREQREKRERERAAGGNPARIPKLTTAETKSPAVPTKPNGSASTIDRKPIPQTNSANLQRGTSAIKKAPPPKCDINNKRSELPKTAIRDANSKQIPRDPARKPTTSMSNGTSSGARPLVKDNKPKEFPPRDLKPKQFPPRDLKPAGGRQFPPEDVRRNGPPVKRKGMPAVKGRIYDDSDEDYDSEMDDFIDDGPEEEEDYSKHIREMFGYDKRKYKYIDDDDDNMVSSFAQQMREEVISTKLGIMEDLEEQRKEEEHNRRKALMRKKR